MTDELNTVGERLVGRPLETEYRHGTKHYVSGQHHAEIVGDEEALFAALSYVNTTGMAIVILCMRQSEQEWEPTQVARRGMLCTDWGPCPIPDDFSLSKKMIDALEEAEARYAEEDHE